MTQSWGLEHGAQVALFQRLALSTVSKVQVDLVSAAPSKGLRPFDNCTDHVQKYLLRTQVQV